MTLNQLKPNTGSRRKHFRVGRGMASGAGKTSGRGHLGQNARSGGGVRPGFEGGQNPLYRRIPKRGFKNGSRLTFAVVNVESLNQFENGTVVTPALLIEAGIVKKELSGIKVLGSGELKKSLKVQANRFSKTAEAAITKAGGSIEVI